MILVKRFETRCAGHTTMILSGAQSPPLSLEMNSASSYLEGASYCGTVVIENGAAIE